MPEYDPEVKAAQARRQLEEDLTHTGERIRARERERRKRPDPPFIAAIVKLVKDEEDWEKLRDVTDEELHRWMDLP